MHVNTKNNTFEPRRTVAHTTFVFAISHDKTYRKSSAKKPAQVLHEP